MSREDDRCIVCRAVTAIIDELPGDALLAPAVVKVTLRAYMQGLEDDGSADPTRFCVDHLEAFDAMATADREKLEASR